MPERIPTDDEVMDAAMSEGYMCVPLSADEWSRWLAAHNARVLREFVRDGVCLSCGDGVLSTGEHIDPDRHAAEEARVRADERDRVLEFVANWFTDDPRIGQQIVDDFHARGGAS